MTAHWLGLGKNHHTGKGQDAKQVKLDKKSNTHFSFAMLSMCYIANMTKTKLFLLILL